MFRVLFLLLIVMSSVAFAQVQEKKEPIKFFEYEQISDKLLREKFIEYKKMFQPEPAAQGYIINYGTDKEIERREKQIVKQMSEVFRGYDPPRISFVRGGNSEKPKTVIWFVPPGAELPKP